MERFTTVHDTYWSTYQRHAPEIRVLILEFDKPSWLSMCNVKAVVLLITEARKPPSDPKEDNTRNTVTSRLDLQYGTWIGQVNTDVTAGARVRYTVVEALKIGV